MQTIKRIVLWFCTTGLLFLSACTGVTETSSVNVAILPSLPPHTPTPSALPALSPSPSPALIRVDPAIPYQTLDGIGADCWTFPYASDLEWDWEAVKFVFDELDIAYVRLAPWLGWWETANDNADPFTIDWAGFSTVNNIIDVHDLPFNQFLHARGIELSLGVWDFGGVSEYCEICQDWLASGSPRRIPPELYPEMGESIAAYIVHMQANGVPIAYTEVQNEPDIEAAIDYGSPEALRDAGRVLVQMLDHFGLQTVMLHAPNLHAPVSNVPWIETWFADETLRQRSAAVSYHTWWSIDRRDYEAIWQAAQRYDKPVWATEVGYVDPGDNIAPQEWHSAFQFAESYYRAIAWSHASRVYHWTLLGFDGAVGQKGERYPMFYVLKHFANTIPPGSVLVESGADDSHFLPLAFQRPDGSYVVIVLNSGWTALSFELTGLAGQVVEAVTSSENAYEVAALAAADGSFHVPALSVTQIIIQP